MCLFCEAESITKYFSTYGQKWGESQIPGSSGGVVSYGFATKNKTNQFGTFDSFILDPNFQTEIKLAFAAWENISDLRFFEAANAEIADIRFGWRDIDGKGSILGQTTVPSGGPLADVVIAFDVNEDWFLFGDAPRGMVDFSSTATHEIGHAIGIDHSIRIDALMNATYSDTIFDLKQDDIDAAQEIYGVSGVERIEIARFFNPLAGGHFFTAEQVEKDVVVIATDFVAEGAGFFALDSAAELVSGSIPIYRFLNQKLGSHFFTGFEEEKNFLVEMQDFIFEGIGYRAFDIETASTAPVHRFFNLVSGGHFFTIDENEKNAVLGMDVFRYEGEAFYAFSELS